MVLIEGAEYHPKLYPHSKYILAPCEFLIEEAGGPIPGSSIQAEAESYNMGVRWLNQKVRQVRELGFGCRVARCTRRAGPLVGAPEGIMWRIEVSYKEGDIRRTRGIPPSDEEFTNAAKIFLPNHPQCHRSFNYHPPAYPTY